MKDRLLLAAAFLAAFAVSAASAAPLRLEKGDHVAIIGNALGERMQHHGWLEALIHARYPDHELVFRNLAFPGDELELRLRSENFGSPDEHLTRVAADVVFAFFGYNESFAGPDGVEEFQKRLERLVDHTLGQKYNGKSAPRLVLFSPIAHENLHDPHLPDGTANNESLRRYTAAMADVARRKSVVFVDLFAPSLEAYAKADSPLTIDGVHLSERGDRIFAPAIEKALFAVEPDPARDSARLEKIRAAVLDKNFHWFERYRTVDGYSIFGGRAGLSFVDGQTNRVVAQREMEVLDVMSANRDRAIWAAAQGKRFAVDDSNTPPFLPVKSNLPGTGPGGTHTFLGAQEAIASMTVHKGMKVNLFASEEKFPELANPVQMAFDPRGRLWVAVMPSYPHWKPKERMDDKVLILEDTDGDGSADRVKVFADHLHVPTGLELWGGGLFVGQMPDLVFLKDTNGDDVADERERVLNGLDSADTHHAMNSFVLDPGGALYFQEGTFHHTQVESIYGPPVRCANAGVFRYEPRTHRFEVYVTYPFANPHGHVFDHWGQDFVTDGTGSVNYYAAAFSGRLDYPDKHRELDPFFQQRIRPCPGTEILSSRHFPDELQGNYLIANVIGFLGILQYEVRDEGAGFKGSEVEPIVQSSDSNFRPSDLEIGPDGALYFLDWQNPIIGHMQHNLRDPNRDRTHGRIYRVSCEGRPLLRPAVIAGAPVASLLNLLKEPEDRVRHRVRIELSSRPASEVLPAAKTWIASLDRDDPSYEHHLLEALWLHQSQDAVDRELLVRLLRSEDFRARAAATRVLCYWRDRIPDALALLAVQADDNYARVRLEAVRAASFFDESRAVDVALTAVKHPLDYYLKYTLGETLRQLEPYWKKAIREGATVAAGNPAGVDFMLAKVSTAELVKLPRSPLVYQAILSRDNVVHESRHEALEGLAKAHGSSVLNELLVAVERLDAQGGDSSERVLHDLAHLLVTSPSSELKAQRARLWKLAVEGRSPVTRQIAFVAVVAADGSPEKAFHEATSAFGTLRDILDAVPLIADAKARAAAHELILPLISALPPELQEAGKASKGTQGRYVRIELPRRGTLTLAEVQVFSGGANVATTGAAKQSSASNGGVASRAIDGNTSGRYSDGGQTHSREGEENPWWELDLGKELPIEAVTVWNRTEGKGQFVSRLEGFTLRVLDASRGEAFVKAGIPAPPESARIDLPAGGADAIRRSAMSALAATGKDDAGNFRLLAKLLREGKDRDGAIRALSRVPRAGWPKEDLPPLIDALLEQIAALAPEDRTQPAARDAFQLGDDAASLLAPKEAQAARKRLRELGVPVFVIRPVAQLMVYDRSKIFVEAGKPVEIVFENADIMPHNLIITRPHALEKVGLAAEKMVADPAAFAKSFVPDLPEVLHATKLLQPQQTFRLSFTAPSEPDEYPYVCTFPGHWRRMYGAMVVVKSLDDVPPEVLASAAVAAPSGPTRPFVRSWTMEDLAPRLEHAGHGRSVAAGKELFGVLSCNRCHRMNGEGGQVGPDLVQVKQKLSDRKATLEDVLREIIEPSKVVEEKFRAQTLVLTDGRLVTGIVEAESDQEVRMRVNPLDGKEDTATVIPKEQIQERVPSEVSLMPMGLLNTLSDEEVLDLLAYVSGAGG